MSQFGSAGRRATKRFRARGMALLAAVPITLLGAGCSQPTARHEAGMAAAPGPSQSAACRAERSRAAALPEPDCEFKEVRQGTVDANEFTRLKLAYERQCYQRAERTARQRLQEAQASRVCQGKPS